MAVRMFMFKGKMMQCLTATKLGLCPSLLLYVAEKAGDNMGNIVANIGPICFQTDLLPLSCRYLCLFPACPYNMKGPHTELIQPPQ